jgi:transposase
VAELQVLDGKLKALKRRLAEAVTGAGSGLMQVYGVGPAGAARILADVGDVARFPDRNHFASWTGTAPIDASSGAQIRHRLSRAGNRWLNHVLYIAGIVQIRHDTPGRRYYLRKLAEGKTPLEAMRCLRRRLSDVVYRQLVADAERANPGRPGRGGPGRATGGDYKLQRGRPNPHSRTFGQATTRTRTPDATRRPSPQRTPTGLGSCQPRRRARGVNVERPTGRTTLTPTKRRRTLPAAETGR